MRSVEREDPYAEPTPQQKYPFLRWLNADDFPAGAFSIFCAIAGGVANYTSGLWFSRVFYHDSPKVLFVWVLLGIASGIGVAVAFISWLADNSWE